MMNETNDGARTERKDHAVKFMGELLRLCQKYKYSIGSQYDSSFVYNSDLDLNGGWPDNWQKGLVLEDFVVTSKGISASYRDDSNKIRDDEIQILGRAK